MTLIRSLVHAMTQYPGEIAIADGENEYTYSMLDQVSAEIAGGLRARGIGPGDLVCLYSTRTWLRVCALMGAWRAGVGVVSIDPAQPRARVERILNRVKPRLLLREPTVEEFDSNIPEVTYLGARGEASTELVDGPIAYVVATSGSTGEPKAVAAPPVVLADLVEWHRTHWRHDAVPHTLNAAAVGFDVGYEEVASALVAGAKLVLVDDHQRRDPFDLVDLITIHQVARTFQPVGGLHGIAMAAAFSGAVPSLREIFVGGERLVINDEVRKFCADNHIQLTNEYGPSETHVVMQYRLSGSPWEWPDHPPIGSVIASAEPLLVEDGVLRAFKRGEEGELVIAGRCVGLYYIGDEELTAQRFRELPHEDGGVRRGYSTGDLVTYDGENFHFVSRVDDQLKVNGYRVEPGEVESVLTRLAGVRRIAVIGVGREAATALVACYVRQDGAEVSEADLRAACARELPEYMMPSHFREFTSLPVNANGKVDRAAIRAQF
ncbi:AMP-dependent synthetase [Kibdelosporangium aridum]|uniref:AMP-dependent synthetase n=1 Tax=Kibdelosporangium aridum TaxID=2030 RepID=A0A428Z4P0_KIBAR|nr:AMP-binding protein [Kibdelosporangium aridum]RSM81604.1 AMP-dependent synthetase [Kibdelosporangium aridum]